MNGLMASTAGRGWTEGDGHRGQIVTASIQTRKGKVLEV
jgi:hypothetical protein